MQAPVKTEVNKLGDWTINFNDLRKRGFEVILAADQIHIIAPRVGQPIFELHPDCEHDLKADGVDTKALLYEVNRLAIKRVLEAVLLK